MMKGMITRSTDSEFKNTYTKLQEWIHKINGHEFKEKKRPGKKVGQKFERVDRSKKKPKKEDGAGDARQEQ